MILIETFVTLTVGITLVIGATLAIGGTLVAGSIRKLTTTTTSITAPTTDLGIPSTAASPVVVPGDSMEAKASTEDLVVEAFMEEAALPARTEWEAFRVEAAVTPGAEAAVMPAAAVTTDADAL
jgi:hypothetical protein